MIIRIVTLFIAILIGSELAGQKLDIIQYGENSNPDLLSTFHLQTYSSNSYNSYYQINKLEQELHKLYYRRNVNTRVYLPCPEKIPCLGDSSMVVYDLKKSLVDRGLLDEKYLNYIFDEHLKASVIRFQMKHSLAPDGSPGSITYRWLNKSYDWYINKLESNLYRLYRENTIDDSTCILVNIPEFKLRYYRACELIFESAVIVGKRKNQTPVLSSKINYIVFNPCWTIPNSIAVKSILPRLKSDSTYLDRRNMFIQQNGRTVNHHSIDFSSYSATNFPFKVFQNADHGNALGKVKFMFNNGYSIYLHDTPSKRLFLRSYRALSHGCVRVQNAMDFAKILLEADTKDHRSTHYYLSKGYPVKVYLESTIPLYITYRTCYYDAGLDMVRYVYDTYKKDLN